MKKQEFRRLIREHIRKIVKEEIDNKQWMDITAALIKSKMFLNKATFRFVNTDTMSKDLTRKSLEDFLMNGAKEGLWDKKVAQEYMMAIEGTAKKQLKEGLDSKPIKSFKVTDLAKIFTKIGFPTTKVEVFDNVSAGPTLSIVFKNTLADENEFIDAYTDFQFDSGALGSWLPDIESAYHKGGNKWEFQMQK